MERCNEKRKLQIGPTLSQHSVRRGLGSHHLTTIEKLEKIQILCNLNYGSPVIPEYQIIFPDLCP